MRSLRATSSLLALWAALATGSPTTSVCGSGVIPTCARDNCLRAVIACNAKPGPSSAQQDCSSALQPTVPGGTVVVTQTTTTTFPASTPAPVTETITEPVTVTMSSTATITTTLPVLSLTSGVFDTTTTVTTVTTTVTVTATTLNANRKRAAQSPAIPTYASACSSFARYSSACACLGITASTSTLPPVTSTTTVTASTTASPPAASTTLTTVTVTSTIINTITSVVTTYASTTVIPSSTSTVSATQTTTETVTVTPYPTLFNLQALGGPYGGSTLGHTNYGQPDNFVFNGGFPTAIFTIDSTTGQLILTNDGQSPAPVCADESANTFVQAAAPSGNYLPLICSNFFSSGGLTCTFNDGDPGLFALPARILQNQLEFITPAASSNSEQRLQPLQVVAAS